MSVTPPALTMAGIVKAFAGTTAVDHASLEVRAGDVVALMGANGAGKSTLMNILGGVVAPDVGEIRLSGRLVSIGSPSEATGHGIAFVHQELNLLPTMTVAENIAIDAFPCRGWRIDRVAMRAEARALLDRLGCHVPVDVPAGRLGTGDRQMIEIARAVRQRPAIIIFDEPTSSLTAPEKRQLFEVIRALQADGAAIVYISHFLDEIFEIANRVTVMRNGRTVAQSPIAATSPDEIVHQMLGQGEAFERLRARSQTTGPVRLQVRGLHRDGVLHDVSFELRAGEIVGLWGLLGAGRTELARALLGLDPKDRGTLRFGREGELREISPVELAAHTGFVTEDRRGEGLLLPLSVEANLALPSLPRLLNRLGLVDRAAQRQLAERAIAQLGIVLASRAQPVATLSGGNQQKVVLGRWLATRPDLFVMDEPTRGLDVHAKSEILKLTAELAATGTAVLLICSELEDLMRVADRYLVMRGGRITAELPGTATRGQLLASVAAGVDGTAA